MCGEGTDITIASTAIAIALAEGRNAQDISMLGTIFSTISTSLFSIAAQKQYCSSSNNQQIEVQ